MKIFILEDDATRNALFFQSLIGHDVTAADNVEDAKKLYTEHAPFDVVLLDHDLGGETYVNSAQENTGAAFCRWLTTPEAKVATFVHSYNPEGAKNMMHILVEQKGWQRVTRLPFGLNLLKWLEGLRDAETKGPEGASN